MAYTVHNFEQGDVLYAEQLNEMDAQIAANEESIENSISSNMLAEDYSANKTYSIGDYVIYDNQLYTCIYEITAPEGWNSTHWRIANLGDGIGNLNRQLSDVEDNQIPELKNIVMIKDESIPINSAISGVRYVNYLTGDLGSTATGELFSHTDYILIKDYSKIKYRRIYTGSAAPAFGMAFYDETKTYISGEKALANAPAITYVEGVVDVPENAVYARFTTLNDITTHGEFSASIINPLYQIALNANSIGDPNFIKNNKYYENLWQYGNYIKNRSVQAVNGGLVENVDYDTTDYIPVREGDIIYGYGARFCCYDSEKVKIDSATGILNNLDTVLSNGMHYYKIPSGASYFRICAYKLTTTYQFLLYLVSPFEGVQQSQGSRTLYALGDSITRGMYAESGASSSSGPTSEGYPYWIGAINGYTVVNLGNSGSGWANVGSPEKQDDPSTAYNAKDVVDNNTFADADIITMAWGVNDWKGAAQNVVLGDMTSTSGDGTVIGNMKYCIEELVTKKPTAQIIVLLPLNTNRQWSGMREMTLSENWAFGYAYRNDQTLQDYRTAIRQCAEYYNVKVVDLEEVCPINRLNIRDVCGDGLHPTQAFYKQMGIALAPLIR